MKLILKIMILVLFIGIVAALGSLLAQAQQNNSKDSIRVIILKNFPPQFVTTKDGPSGLAVEMIREVAQRASLKIEFVTLNSWKEVYEPLKNGTVDVMSNMGISEARKKILEFTDPYEVFDIKIFVRKETHDIKTIDDLSGKLLGVQTTNVLTKGLVKSGEYQLKQYASFKLALLGLLSGEVDAMIAPTEPFLLIARGARLDDRIKFVGPSLLEVKRAIALPKGRTKLRDRLNKSLRKFKQTDDYQKLLTKWYGSATPYWTTPRVVMFTGIIFAASIMIMGVWRYYSIIGLNRRIHESENQKKLIIQTVPDLIWSKDTEGVYLACNAKFERLLGAAEAQIIGKTDYDFFDRDIADAILKQDKLAIKDKSLTYEKEVTFADDGHKEVMLMTKTLMKSVDGIVLGTLGVGRDITQIKQSEEMLQIERDNLRNIFESMEDGIYIINQQYDIQYVNPALAKDFGPYKSMKCYKYFHDRNDVCPWCKYLDVQKGKTVQWEWYSPKNGKTYDLLDTPITLPDGSTGKLEIFRDITDRKKTEKELKDHHEQLEELVEQRTQELKEKTDKIEESRKALTYLVEDVNQAGEELRKINMKFAAANKELKEFAYIVSHDLKAPLRAISQLTHWISQDYSHVFDDDGKLQMELIIKRVKRMDGLIDGILRYSRVGRIREKEESLDLNLIVNEVIDTLAAPDHVKIIIENKLPVVVRDSIRMEQVFQNLIGNAIKFMDKDEGIIKVGCVDEDTSWKFSVSDNGPGIDERYHDKIFQIFQTLTARDEHESTGIGLTLVKKIIGLYGGSVWVESQTGQGTTFFFTLPKKGEKHEKL